MARMMRAKKKMAQQKAQAAASESVDPMEPSVAQQGPGVGMCTASLCVAYVYEFI